MWQTFQVPSGVSALTGAGVQIDPNNGATARLSVEVNGVTRAVANAVPSGDTRFEFPHVPVSPGEHVRLLISFSSTFAKNFTVYTAGGSAGTFVTSNSCSDGAPSVHRTDTSLRAEVYGLS